MSPRKTLITCLLAAFGLSSAWAEPKAFAQSDSAAVCLRVLQAPLLSDPLQEAEQALHALVLAKRYAPELQAQCRLRLAEGYIQAGAAALALGHSSAFVEDTLLQAKAMHLMATAEAAMEQHDRAIATWSRLLSMEGLVPALRLEAHQGIIESAARAGKPFVALAHGELLRGLQQGKGDRLGAGRTSNTMGQLAAGQGRLHAAMRFYMEAIADLGGYPERRLEARLNKVSAQVRLGFLREALNECRAIITEADRMKSVRIRNKALRVLTAALVADGQALEARFTAQTALQNATADSDPAGLLETHALLARLCRLFHEDAEADAHERQVTALQEAQKTGRNRDEQRSARLVEQLQRIELRYMRHADEQDRQQLLILRAEAEAAEADQLLEHERLTADLRASELIREREQAEQAARLAAARSALEDERNQRIIQELELRDREHQLELSKRAQREAARAQQVSLLERDRDLNALKLRGEQARRIVMRGWVAVACAGALLALLAAIIMRRKNRTIGRQVQRIDEMNKEIKLAHADLVGSIAYAQRIQQSILPTEAEIRQHLPESFLIYKPRDIVSGDLPYIRVVGDRLFLAAIDCTGHGVPAAMLSFMAYYSLNAILAEGEARTPGEILDQLHARVREAMLSQGPGELSDGMDITLVELLPDRRSIRFSAARNGLLRVRNGACERFTGDRRSIGETHPACTSGFTTQTLEARPGDRFYLYSDGVIHQFGGPMGRKKFSSKRLMGMLAALGEKPVAELGQEVQRVQEQWQQDIPQTDDIVLIGFSTSDAVAAIAA